MAASKMTATASKTATIKFADLDDVVQLDPTDKFDAILIDMVKTNRKKRADYAGEGANIFQNFIDSSYHVNATPGQSVEILIATKESRLRNLLTSTLGPQNESIEDTLLDRAVYSVLALAMYREGYYTTAVVAPRTEV